MGRFAALATTKGFNIDAARAAIPAHLVAPAAAWLVHEACEATGMLFVARGATMARAFMSQTRGIASTPGQYTIEAIHDRFGEIVATQGAVPEEVHILAGARRIAELLGVPCPIDADEARRIEAGQ
ncbi:MAG: hypothetical protein AB7Q97_00235 [Gammaproteobacteria bacterium]